MSSNHHDASPEAAREHSVGRQIVELGRMARSYVDAHLEPLGIGFSQAQILVVLYGEDGISQHEICSRLHLHKSVLARTIRRLVDEGYVERLSDPADDRAYRVVLTGHARLEESDIRSVLRGWTTEVTSGVSDDEYRLLRDVLARMIDNASRALPATLEPGTPAEADRLPT